MKAYFMALDLDLASLNKIFKLLDVEKKGKVDLERFVDGCIRLRGVAKMVDMSILESQCEGITQQLAHLEKTWSQRFNVVERLLEEKQKGL